MGKYSLESFERYPMIKCRPEEIKETMQGCGENRFVTVRAGLGEPLPVLKEKTLLEIIIGTNMETIAEAESSLRSFASHFYRDPLVLGVTITADCSASEKYRLWETAAEAFAPKRFFIPISDGVQLDYAMKHGFAGGILAVVENDPYDVCEAFAENNAQQLFKQMPVLVSFKGEKCGMEKYAGQWHATAVEGLNAPSGWRIALRRCTYPKQLTSGGYAPMRFWWTNKGPGFCHENVSVRLRLEKDGQYLPIMLHDHQQYIHLADRVHNEIVKLPCAEPGTYRLEYGIFTTDGEALQLAHRGRTADGYYFADVMHIDNVPRPEYETIWDDFFADGYYPLEDPQQPG